MSIIDMLRKIENLYHLKPVTEQQIKNAECELSLSFADEYREYVSQYGAVSFSGHEITGISNFKASSVVFMTLAEKQFYDVPNDWYVIERVGYDGVLIWQSGSGAIYLTKPNEKTRKIYNSLAEYINGEINLLNKLGDKL